MKFLIDECLSPELVETARNRGYHGSTHVNWLGLTSEKDWVLMARAVEDDYVFVTSNRTDFKALSARESLHPGLICLNVEAGEIDPGTFSRLFQHALGHLGDIEPVNEVVEITLDRGGRVQINRYEWPSEGL